MDLKLAELLLKYDIKGTFYIAPLNKEQKVMKKLEIKELSKLFDIGAHTLTHPNLCHVYGENLNEEICSSKNELETIINKPVKMFCYPKGKHNRKVREAVKEANFLGARTVREFSLDPGHDRFQIATSILAYPLPTLIRIRHEVKTLNWRGLYVLGKKGIHKSWIELALYLFAQSLKNGGVWHLWGHSWEIEKYSLWKDLEAILCFISKRQEVEYLSNSDLIGEFIN